MPLMPNIIEALKSDYANKWTRTRIWTQLDCGWDIVHVTEGTHMTHL